MGADGARGIAATSTTTTKANTTASTSAAVPPNRASAVLVRIFIQALFSFEDQLSISCVVRRSDDPRSFLVGETAAGRCPSAYRWPFDVVAQHIDRVGIPCDGGTDDEPQYIAVRLGLAGAVHNNSKEPSCDEETGCSAVHPSRRPPRDGDIREGERLVSNESEVVNLFARLVVIPVRWLYAGLYRVGILEVSGDSHYQPGHG